MKRRVVFLLGTLPLACSLRLGFEDQKGQVKVVSYRGDAGLDGRAIGSVLASGDIDLVQEESRLRDLVVGQADPGSLAAFPLFFSGDSLEGRGAAIKDDPRAHFGTDLATELPAFTDDAAKRRFGTAVQVQNLGGDAIHDGPELLIGAPAQEVSEAGNVIILDGDSRSFGFGLLTARIAGVSAEPNFGASLALGDLDGDDVAGELDLFQVLAVGAPSADASAGSVYLYRFEAGNQGKASLCDQGLPPALQLDGAALDAQLSAPLGPSFGAQLTTGELGLGGLDARDELVITEPEANRVIVVSFNEPAGVCAPLSIAQVLELPLSDAPGAIAVLDAGTATASLVVGLPNAQNEAGELARCDLTACAALATPTLDFLRLGDFALVHYGAALIAADIDGQNGDDLLIGAPGSRVSGALGAGSAVLLFADGAGGFITGGPNTAQVFADLAPEAEAAFGTSLAILGDISEDGLQEVAIGAPGAGDGKGEVFLYLDIDTDDFTSPLE